VVDGGGTKKEGKEKKKEKKKKGKEKPGKYRKFVALPVQCFYCPLACEDGKGGSGRRKEKRRKKGKEER